MNPFPYSEQMRGPSVTCSQEGKGINAWLQEAAQFPFDCRETAIFP